MRYQGKSFTIESLSNESYLIVNQEGPSPLRFPVARDSDVLVGTIGADKRPHWITWAKDFERRGLLIRVDGEREASQVAALFSGRCNLVFTLRTE